MHELVVHVVDFSDGRRFHYVDLDDVPAGELPRLRRILIAAAKKVPPDHKLAAFGTSEALIRCRKLGLDGIVPMIKPIGFNDAGSRAQIIEDRWGPKPLEVIKGAYNPHDHGPCLPPDEEQELLDYIVRNLNYGDDEH